MVINKQDNNSLEIAEMTRTITNPKPLQTKSRTHEVVQTGNQTFEVTSGTSGNAYYVTLLSTGGMTCSCKWGQYRNGKDPRSGCSHVQAAYTFHTGRKSSAWNNEQDARRQHRPIIEIGDGVTLTTRKTSPAK